MVSGTLGDKVARVLFTYQNTPQTTTGVSPAELLMGHKLRSQLDLLRPDLSKRVELKQQQQKAKHDMHTRDRLFLVGDPVFIKSFRRGVEVQWTPGQITGSTGLRSFHVQLEDGRIVRRHSDYIRYCTAPPMNTDPWLLSSDPSGEEKVDVESRNVNTDSSETETPSLSTSGSTQPEICQNSSNSTQPEIRRNHPHQRHLPDYYAPLVSH